MFAVCLIRVFLILRKIEKKEAECEENKGMFPVGNCCNFLDIFAFQPYIMQDCFFSFSFFYAFGSGVFTAGLRAP